MNARLRMRVAEYCKCGASMVGEIHPTHKANVLKAAFWVVHFSAGCGKATAREAAQARRLAEVAVAS